VIHLSSRLGPIKRINTSLVDDVVVVAFVCASRVAAASVIGVIDGRLVEDNSLDFSPVADLAEPDPFPPGSAVSIRYHEWTQGEMSIEGVVTRRLSADRLEVRTRMGRLGQFDQRDLRARPVQ
jgi:hypothetical protein